MVSGSQGSRGRGAGVSCAAALLPHGGWERLVLPSSHPTGEGWQCREVLTHGAGRAGT